MQIEDAPKQNPQQVDNLNCLYFLLAIALAIVLYITGVNFIGEELIQLWFVRFLCVLVLTFLLNKVMPKANKCH